MRLFPKCFAALLLLAIVSTSVIQAQLGIEAVDVTGDRISKAFNASSSFPCSNGDQENYNWITSDTHGNGFCSAGIEGVSSVFERMECDAGANLFAPFPNHAASGATLVHDFFTQAGNVKTYLSAQPVQRMAVVFLGHNDNCSGVTTKSNPVPVMHLPTENAQYLIAERHIIIVGYSEPS